MGLKEKDIRMIRTSKDFNFVVIDFKDGSKRYYILEREIKYFSEEDYK